MPIDNEGIRCRTRTHCPNCSKFGVRLHEGLQDYLFEARGMYGFRRCPDRVCGMVWLDPTPIEEDLGKLYETYYTHGDARGRSFAAHGVKRYIKHALAWVVFWRRTMFRSDFFYLQGRPPGRLLEIGCGAGSFLRSMQERGWEVQGLDFDERAVAAATRAGVEARVGGKSSTRAFPRVTSTRSS